MCMVVQQAVTLAALGVVVGIAAVLPLTRVLQRMLFGISALEPFTYLAVSVLLIVIAALAAYIPARRAAQLTLSVALRTE